MKKRESKTDFYKQLGYLCREFREQNDIRLIEMAYAVHTSPSNIAKFEEGKNDNYNILIAYINRGFDLMNAIEVIESEDI